MDPDQMASSVFSKKDKSGFSKARVKPFLTDGIFHPD